MKGSLWVTKGVRVWHAFAQSLGLILFRAAYAWSELQFVGAPSGRPPEIRPSEIH